MLSSIWPKRTQSDKQIFIESLIYRLSHWKKMQASGYSAWRDSLIEKKKAGIRWLQASGYSDWRDSLIQTSK